ncbi:uncharacterized protein EI90DRAFT_2921046 [Cantharellus anzutake]|uniref:uncharacterized protein n=1 Tax=Cantharellus anzutake TaxID=1750568 RepID=UPI001905A322|nr:uncharacterized protein EI90DRAFT_2921046 [Cantharellus anzutake]KAF8331027.1 hypothetical protein EI90DRAFT_2921046 [Cantharellus anzutake]
MAAALVSFILTQSIYAAPDAPQICQHPPPNNSTALSINYSDACNDLRTCQTMWSMVYSCLLTIFACVWTAMHPGVPKQYSAWSPQTGSRRTQMILTLVLPEMIVAAAWEDFSMARRMSKKCAGIKGWTLTHSYFVNMGGFFDYFTQEVVEPDGNEDPCTLFEKYPGIIHKSGDDRKVAITREQILDRSKGDFLAKSVVVLQLLWFTTQYAGRWASHLPRSQLETMTLAYAALSILIYALWWHKPLDVHFPIPVTEETHPDPQNSEAIADQVMPKMENASNPTSPPAETLETTSLWILAVTGIIFGGIHCLAWSFPFPTRAEKLLWRISAIIITLGPGSLAWSYVRQEYAEDIIGFFGGLPLALYPFARIILFTLTFTSLRSPPPTLYRTISWTSFIPHLG